MDCCVHGGRIRHLPHSSKGQNQKAADDDDDDELLVDGLHEWPHAF